MSDVIRFALLGLGLGALYSLASQGLIVIYRGSGVLNFAQGAMGMVGAYAAWDLQTNRGVPFLGAFAAGVALAALIGAVTYLVVMRPLHRASPLARIVATLGVLIILQSIAILRYGVDAQVVPTSLPSEVVHVFGVSMSIDRFVLLGIAIALTAVLWVVYRWTRFGLATTAVAENQRTAAAIGLSGDAVATANWALGAALAGAAAILVAPIVTLQVSVMTNLVLAAMAAALVASFRSFPLALAAGMAIGIGQSELTRFVSTPGAPETFPFVVIVLVVVLRGQALPLRDFFLQRLPSVGSGRIRASVAVPMLAVAGVLLATLSPTWLDALIVTFATGLVLLSIVVLTGYGGQLSLAQFALAGFGAWIAGRLDAGAGWPAWAAFAAGVLACVPLGVLFALPAVRTRGINLAIVTLGLGTAVEQLIFNNGDLTGGFAGTVIGTPKLFGWDISAIDYPRRYGLIALVCFTVGLLAVANLRRGRTGRRLLAVRTNDRAAAALGISVPEVKLYAFALSASLAAAGGILLAFRQEAITYVDQFASFTSITAVGWAFIGGIGYITGGVIGALQAPGALGTRLTEEIFSGITQYVTLIGGGFLVLLVVLNQDGIAPELLRQVRAVGRWLPGRSNRAAGSHKRVAELPPEDRGRVVPRSLEVRDLSVRYGGVVAVDDVSFVVAPGHILGLIGPNGAGKTSVIDAITGFTKAARGSVLLDGRDVTRRGPAARARAGLCRSFQSLELFEDLTVLDNLRAASDPRDRRAYLTDLVHPKAPALPGAVVAAIREFQLTDVLDRPVGDLPYGQRRLLAIARAVATNPSVLLLDEPAAGLSEQETAELGHLVRRLADERGMAILLIEHDMDFVMSICDELVVLDFGRTISTGTPDAVRAAPAVVAAYLGEPDEVEEAPRIAGGMQI